MSSTILRHYTRTVSYIPTRHGRRMGKAVRTIRTRISRRRFRQAAQALMHLV